VYEYADKLLRVGSGCVCRENPMNRGHNKFLWIGTAILLMLSGCASTPVGTEQSETRNAGVETSAVTPHYVKEPPAGQPKPKSAPVTMRRVVTEKELRKLAAKDPDLDFNRCVEILSRLNKKDKEYIRRDMKQKRPLIAPRNFTAFKDWSPLPVNITGAKKFPKFILVVKNIHFLGWYQNGRLIGDTYICIGKMNNWTKKGMYRVNEKDSSHMSTYPNAFGEPALMPDALHIYERVWIHAGDVVGPNCSHGCINVPIVDSVRLYDWADVGTVVLITESLKDLARDIKSTPIDIRPQKTPSMKEKGRARDFGLNAEIS